MSWSWRACAPLAAAAVLLLLAAAPVHAKTYSADRFDAVVRVQPDGSLEVTETVRFVFESGTFREVFREIPLRRTDGIEVLDAAMDGTPLPRGQEIGTVEVARRGDRVRVVWRFAPVQETTREFVLRYAVRGAIRRDGDADRLVWRATPDQHQYVIRDSTVRFELPVAPSAEPGVRVRRAGAPLVTAAPAAVQIHARDVRKNGWIEATLEFPPASIAAVPPEWQQRAARVQAQAGRWVAIAAAMAGGGVLLLALMRHGHDRPPGGIALTGAGAHQAYPPDDLDAALAGMLVSNGHAGLQHAVAILFTLAERGELEIRERRRTWGIREYLITRRTVSPGLREYERTAVDLVFKNDTTPGSTVALSTARSRLAMRTRRLAAALTQELLGARLIEPARLALRRRYNRVGLSLLAVSAAGFGMTGALMTPEHGGWPLLLPAAVLAVALAAFIFGSTVTPLSNEGVRRASRWRAYRAHLREIAAGREPLPAPSPDGILPYAVAFNLAYPWSKYLKRHGHRVPAWFHAARPEDAYGAFPAFVAAGGAGASGSGGAGGAAGGGGSGAG